MLTALATVLSLACPQTAAATTTDPVAAICAKFVRFDHNGDDQVEIAGVTPVHAAGDAGPRMLVLVESHLLGMAAGPLDLRAKLRRLVDDLAAEGQRAVLLDVELGVSAMHQDGRYVLALRELLRAFARDNELAGALLVGRFPDAYLVRTCNWRRHDEVKLRSGQADEVKHIGHYLRRVPEAVAHRADIVLSDLDGRWEDVYVQPRTRLATTLALFADKIPASGGEVIDLEHGSVTYEDFFHVSDGKLEVHELLGTDGVVRGHSVFADDHCGDHECSATDRASPNVMARPDILVSRMDAHGIAMRARTDIVGVSGEGLLDDAGKPQAVAFGDAKQVPDWRSLWQLDPVLERQLLADYLDRNHAYRTRQVEVAWRPTSIAHGLGSGFREMSHAASDWLPGDKELSDVHQHATLASVARWLAYPAVLRTLRAHSDAWGSVFERAELNTLTAELNGPAWSWSREGKRLVPSLKSACGGGKLDWHLLHTLWQNGAVASSPSFYHHTGCEGISPPGSARLPYDHANYGLRQGAESLLFFGNGLALVGRAKVFYDEPRGFAQALAEGKTFGAAWAGYFEIEATAASWAQVGGDIGRKRAYFWSVLGDATLRLQH